MREGWEIKKLGDICSSFSGYTPSADLLHEVGNYPYFKVAEMNRPENLRVMSSTDAFIDNPTKVYRKGAIVFPKNGAAISTNKKRMLGQDSVVDLNTGGFLADEKYIAPSFLYYLMQHIDFKQYVRRGAVPTLDIKELKARECLVPPIQVQKKIVAELDCLANIIEKKKQQLKELDNLAQSIFYDLFGDPITNEKGWEMRKLKEVAEIVGGSTPRTNVEEFWNGEYPWVAPAELHQNHYISSTERGISFEAAKNMTLLPVGTVLLSSRAPIGKVSITAIPMYCNQGFKNVICSPALNNEYVYQLLLGKTEYLNALGTGATFKEISKKTTENIAIAVPPIELQETFAEQAVAVERQKELIKKSITETETLFNSRMGFWFNL